MYIYSLYTLNKPVCSVWWEQDGDSTTDEGIYIEMAKKQEQPQYRNSASSSESEKSMIDVVHRSRKMGLWNHLFAQKQLHKMKSLRDCGHSWILC